MAYYTGSAANLTAVLTGLTAACEAEGWTWSGGILSKADPGIFVRLAITPAQGDYTILRAWGRSAVDSGEMGLTGNEYVSMCLPIKGVDVSYPVTYHAFVFSSEVFFIINYSDKFQWLAFGQSDQGGLGGTGNWVAATCGYLPYPYSSWIYPTKGVDMVIPSTVFTNGLAVCPAIGWNHLGNGGYDSGNNTRQFYVNTWINDGLDATDAFYPWTNSVVTGVTCSNITGIGYISELLNTQPNNFNNEGVMLPIKVFKKRAESKFSQILQVQNARHIRVDNYASTEVISLGTDQWMIFPWYCKNTATRDGGPDISHTGTFGWAIKYEPAV